LASTPGHGVADPDEQLFSGRYAQDGLGSRSGAQEHSEPPMSLWGAPTGAGDEADTTREPAATSEAVAAQEERDDVEEADTTPTRVPTGVERDPLTDTGRHARIQIEEPSPNGTALHLPLDDPDTAPDGYPIKADTKVGLYWVPGSTLYDDARAEIWFASEELARTNGFVRAN
jgi:uncharacterized protein with LGFP repeats